MHFSADDKAKLAAQKINPTATLSYSWASGCLVWSDESAAKLGLSKRGEVLLDALWRVRGFIHSGHTEETLKSRGWEVWNNAVSDGVKWIGFSRIKLDGVAKEFFERSKKEESPSGWGAGLTWDDVE